MKIKIDSLNHFGILSLRDLSRPVAPHIVEKSLQQPIVCAALNRRICVCCGEPMAARGNSLSRNPNMCASCSSLDDGMEGQGNQAVENDEAGNARGSRLPSATNRNANRRFE